MDNTPPPNATQNTKKPIPRKKAVANSSAERPASPTSIYSSESDSLEVFGDEEEVCENGADSDDSGDRVVRQIRLQLEDGPLCWIRPGKFVMVSLMLTTMIRSLEWAISAIGSIHVFF